MTLRRWIFFAFLAAAAAARAGDALWDQAKAAYDQKDFAAARDAYEKLSTEGWGGAPLAYNLGGAYERLGQRGRARLWYERALAEAPSDDDARHNRDLVMVELGLKPDPAPPPAPGAGVLSWIFAALNVVFFGILWRRLLKGPDETWWWMGWAAGLALAAAAAAMTVARAQAREEWGVVTAPRAEARVAPSERSAVGFVAPEGGKIAVLSEAGDWREVGVPEAGQKGWVHREEVELIRF